MSLAPSFSPPCFYTYGNNNQQQQLHQTHYHSPQPQYNHSFSAERRRRVTLLHAPKNQLSKTNHFTTITTAIPKQQLQQEQQNINNDNKKPLSTNINRKKKVVRFYDDDKLENIRLFLKTQKPLAIRDGDPALSLDLKYPNWPAKTTMSMRNLPMIRMESVQASISQQTTLIGRCRVANLAFEKHVVVRYTTDYWQSFHETTALYREPIGSSCNTWDRFTFLIDLGEFFIRRRCRDTTTTIYLALRYTVNEKEYWDNNDGLNYQIDIIPTTLHEDGNDQEAIESITTTTIIENNSTQPSSLATIEKEEGQALHRGNIQNKNSIKQQEQQKKHQHQQKKSITSNTASSTITTTTTTINTITTTATTTTTSSIPKTAINNTKKKLGHRYDFGASLSEAKKTPYDVYQFGKGPMLRFSTLTKQEEDDKDGFQSGYHDFVNKYCFYGTNYSSPGSSPSSSLSCPSSEPICG